MKSNVGGWDRGARVVVGLAIIGLGVAYQSWWGAIGLVPLLTAAIGWCPPYALLGVSTCHTAPASACGCSSCACTGTTQGGGA